MTVANEQAIANMSAVNQGFLNRIGKRNLVVKSIWFRQIPSTLPRSTSHSSSSWRNRSTLTLWKRSACLQFKPPKKTPWPTSTFEEKSWFKSWEASSLAKISSTLWSTRSYQRLAKNKWEESSYRMCWGRARKREGTRKISSMPYIRTWPSDHATYWNQFCHLAVQLVHSRFYIKMNFYVLAQPAHPRNSSMHARK